MTLSRLNIGGGKLLIATTLAFGMLTTVCHAYSAEQEQLCTGDAMRLCGSEIPDVERVTACMIRQRASLSEGCKSVFQPAPAAAPVAYHPPAGRPSKPINLVPARVK
jgi:glycerol-3-phosphate dehydrogenase